MEHLLSDDTAHEAPFTVPFVAFGYDGGDFLTFPDRQGWDISEWEWSEDYALNGFHGEDSHGRRASEIAAFLQTWLFFGLLQVALGEVPIRIEDFQCAGKGCETGNTMLSTRKLEDYLVRRAELLEHADDESKHAKLAAFMICLHKAARINQHFNSGLYFGTRRPDTVVLQRTVLAQKLLCELLSGVVSQGTPVNILEGVSNDIYLENRMLRTGWCPSTVRFMQSQLPLQLQIYAFARGSVRTQIDHSSCFEAVSGGCRHGNIPPDFKVKHAREGCDCDLVPVPMGEVVSVLRSGQIPVITIRQDGDLKDTITLIVDGVSLDRLPGATPKPYVAFSHVWSDGLGNPASNYLPACQIARIAEALRSLRGTDSQIDILSSYHETTASKLNTFAFWLDTLCIPVDPQFQDLRDLSIQRMRDIFAKASGVVVLDPDLQMLPSDTRPLTVMMKILCSSWRSRLWTYQEAALNGWVHFPTHDSCFTFRLKEDIITSGSPPGIVEAQLLEFAWQRFNELACDRFAGHLAGVDQPRALHRMVLAATHRSTSRLDDQSICLATFLDMNPKPLLSSDPADRLPELFLQLKAIPPEILFSHGRRLERPGFRWAPKSFLAPDGLWSARRITYPQTYYDPVSDTRRPIPLPVMHPSRLGLSVICDGIMFESALSSSWKIFTVVTADHKSYQVELSHGSLEIPRGSTESQRTLAEDSTVRSLAIIIMDTGYCHWSIIVEVDSKVEDDAVFCHWHNVVTVLDESSNREDWVKPVHEVQFKGDFVEHRHWIID